MDSETRFDTAKFEDQVGGVDINSWRRGFTPQAEIWNGRMAMFGLVVGIGTLILIHVIY